MPGFQMQHSKENPNVDFITLLVPRTDASGTFECVFHDNNGHFDNNNGKNYKAPIQMGKIRNKVNIKGNDMR